MPTGIFNPGRPTATRRPAPLFDRPRGYRDNIYTAFCADNNAGAFDQLAFNVDAGNIPIFLFAQDAPCALMVRSHSVGMTITDDNADTIAGVDIDGIEHCFQRGDMDAARMATLVTAPNPAAVGYGQACQASTFTNGVTVEGYGFEVDPLDTSAAYTVGAIWLSLLMIGQSGVLAGPQSTGGYGNQGVGRSDAIILDETDYTQAMQDAGNVWTDTNGDVWNIVGICNVPSN